MCLCLTVPEPAAENYDDDYFYPPDMPFAPGPPCVGCPGEMITTLCLKTSRKFSILI